MTRIGIALGSLALASCVSAARKEPPGLPGELHGVFAVTGSVVTSSTVDAAGAPVEREGHLTVARYSMGALVGATKFASATGFEISTGWGWLTGDVTRIDPATSPRRLYVDLEGGGLTQFVSLQPAGKVRIRLAADYGGGVTRDDGYVYAGARGGIGTQDRRFVVDGTYRRRFGDVTGNPGALEDRARGVITFRPKARSRWALQASFDYVRGDQRTLDSAGMEMAREDFLLRGRYEWMAISLAIGVGQQDD